MAVQFDRKMFEKYYHKAEQCKDNDDRLVQLVDLMVGLLKASGRAKEKHVHPKSMAPSSRQSWRQPGMFRKGSKIIRVGVPMSRCGPDQAIAFENNPITNNVRTNMRKTISSAPLHFQEVSTGEAMIEAGSVGCGHFNQFRAAIIDGREVPVEFRIVLCEPGKKHLDPERLCKDQHVLKKLLDLDLKFTVTQADVETEYPKLPSMIQKP